MDLITVLRLGMWIGKSDILLGVLLRGVPHCCFFLATSYRAFRPHWGQENLLYFEMMAVCKRVIWQGLKILLVSLKGFRGSSSGGLWRKRGVVQLLTELLNSKKQKTRVTGRQASAGFSFSLGLLCIQIWFVASVTPLALRASQNGEQQ